MLNEANGIVEVALEKARAARAATELRDEDIKTLCEIANVNNDEARAALEAASGDLDKALEQLLASQQSGSDEEEEDDDDWAKVCGYMCIVGGTKGERFARLE